MKAICGLDFVRGPNWTPVDKSFSNWRRWANKKAEIESKKDKVKWYVVCDYIKSRNAVRISFVGQPEQEKRWR